MNLENLDTLHGTLERPLTTSGWLVPQHIWIERQTLRYLIGEGGAIACRTMQPSAGLLETFVRLANATPERILQFGRGQRAHQMVRLPPAGSGSMYRLDVARALIVSP